MLIRENLFRGQIPAVAPQHLPEGAAQVSKNAVREGGNIRPLKDTAYVVTPAKAGVKKAIHLFAGSFWFHWLAEVDAVRAPIEGDTQERTVFTGDGVPKVTDASIATAGGGALYPNNSYPLGLPAPVSAPTVAVIGAATILPLAVTGIGWESSGAVFVTIAAHGLDSEATYYGSLYGTDAESLDGEAFQMTVRDANSLYVAGLSSIRSAAITAITKANPARVTAAGHGLLTGDTAHLSVNGMTQLHNWEGAVTVVDANSFTLDGVDSTLYDTFTSGSFELVSRATSWSPVTITALTNADPAKATAAAHGLATDERIVLSVSGMTELDGWIGKVVKVDVDHFTLRNLDDTDVDSSLYGSFTSGSFTRLCRWEPATDPSIDDGLASTFYVETFLRRWSGIDEEGPPSPASPLVDVNFASGQSVQITALNAAPAGGYNITHRRLYRAETDSGATSLHFVAEQAIADTDYTDGALSSAVAENETLQSQEYTAPPDDLSGIRAMPNGVLVGISAALKAVCFCEPYQSHAWPTRYRLAVDYVPVGVEVFGSSVLVTTEGVPYVATGAQPGYMTMDRTEIAQACVARRGMADLGSAVAYPSPDGLMVIGSGIAENVTRNLFTRAQWQALKPSSFVAAAHNDKYYAFYDTGAAQGCLILDLSDGSADFCDIAATAVHVDLLTDSLYLQRGDDIVKWDAGSALTLNRKGKRHGLPRPACLTAARVKAGAYPLTFKLHAKLGSAADATAVAAASSGLLTASGDTVTSTTTVASSRPFRLPGGYLAEHAELEVSGGVEIEEIVAAETMSELRQV